MAAKDFVINRHGRLVFPSNAWPRLDFSVFTTVGQLSAAVSRDFEAKAPTASQIVAGLKSSRLSLPLRVPGRCAPPRAGLLVHVGAGAGPSGGYFLLPGVLGGFFSGPERSVSHPIHCGHHDPWCSVAPASHWSGSAGAGGPCQ